MRDSRDPTKIGKWLLRGRRPGPKSRLHRKADRLHEVEIDDFKETHGQVTGRAVR